MSPEEKITIKNIKNALRNRKYIFFDNGDPWNVNIVGIRGENPGTNAFDDFITMTYRNEKGEWIFHKWPATTDPGKYWLNHPLNTKGTAVLVPGQYRGSHMIGLHKGYEALVQKRPLKVYRDNNQDNVIDLDPKTVEEGIFGINIHRSNPFTESYYVDKWSAGCQVFKRVDDFLAFMSICRVAAESFGNSFTYTLIEEKDLLMQKGEAA